MAILATAPPASAHMTRGIWVWTTTDIITTQTDITALMKALRHTKANAVYLYLLPFQLVETNLQLRHLLTALNQAKIAAYAMDGYRGYFSDVDGPAVLYQGVDNMLTYNAAVPANEQFAGYMLDMEPQDGQGVGPNDFHNHLAESHLSSTQRASRDALMLDWLTIHATVKAKLGALRLASSLPSWTDDYFGEPVLATYHGVTADVTLFLMAIVDDYCIMSYNTNPLNAANRVVTKLQYADTLSPNQPRVSAAVETHIGAGHTVSYADTPPKNNRGAVITDIDILFTILSVHPSFAGVNIHDWVGWEALALGSPLAATNLSGWIP